MNMSNSEWMCISKLMTNVNVHINGEHQKLKTDDFCFWIFLICDKFDNILESIAKNYSVTEIQESHVTLVEKLL